MIWDIPFIYNDNTEDNSSDGEEEEENDSLGNTMKKDHNLEFYLKMEKESLALQTINKRRRGIGTNENSMAKIIKKIQGKMKAANFEEVDTLSLLLLYRIIE